MKKQTFQTLFMIVTICLFLSVFPKSSSGLEYNTEWTLQIDGAVSNPINLTLTEIIALPKTSVYAELYCYGKLVTKGLWTGVTLESILQKAEFDQQAKSVEFYAEDGYKVTLSIADLAQKGLIAYELDGDPLPETLRLVFPQTNGDRWIALIIRMVVSLNDAPALPPVDSSILPDIPLEPSPTVEPTPTPPPTSSPSPSTSPSVPPSPDPSPSPITPETTQINQESFPLTWTLTAITIVAIVSAALIVFFKKRGK